jgi:hypothetical protein
MWNVVGQGEWQGGIEIVRLEGIGMSKAGQERRIDWARTYRCYYQGEAVVIHVAA